MTFIRLLLYFIIGYFLASRVAKGADYVDPNKLLEVTDVSVDLYRIGCFRDAYFSQYERQIDRGANLNVGLRAFRSVFYEAQIHMLGDSAQLRQAGLQFRTGIELGRYVDLTYWHHSQHALDDASIVPDAHFPILDAYGLRFHFITGGNSHGY